VVTPSDEATRLVNELVEAADEKVLARTIARYDRVDLFRTAFLLTGDRHSAEDLLQDALTKSWAFAQRTGIEQPGAFLRRCMVNQYLSQWRRRRLVREEPTDLADMPEGTHVDGSEPFEARDSMWQALATLPRHQRVILVLRFYEDMSEAQIADLLGVGVGSVRSGSWRGLERLRNELFIDTKDQHV